MRLGRWDSTSNQSTIHAQDILCGAPSGYTRHYLSLEDNWSGGFTQFSLERNRIPVFSIHSWDNNKNGVPWAEVADGVWDNEITLHASDLLALMNASAARIRAWVGWHHEPENEEDGKTSGDISGTCGTRAECKGAGTRFLGIVQGVMGDKVRIGQTLMKGSYTSGRYTDWLPGNAWWCGVDGYSHGNSTETFANIFTPAYNAAVASGRKLLIQEMGVEEIPTDPAFKARFFSDARSTLKTWGACAGAIYSNVQAKGDYTVNSTPQSLAAFQAWAQDPNYRGDWT